MSTTPTDKAVVENELLTIQTKGPLEDIEIQNPELYDLSYLPQSDACGSVETIVPLSMRYDMHKAIETVDRRVNGVDEYVAEKLGYIVGKCTLDQRKEGLKCLCDAFSAEQVDALAVNIYNIEQKGQACIIGDQTGIGKGRIAAGMIRYAHARGVLPIFITEKPNLFSDLYRDIVNIMSDDGIPIELQVGTKMQKKRRAKLTKEELEEQGLDTDGEAEDDYADEFEEVPVMQKNKAFPSFTYEVTDEDGKKKMETRVGKVFLKPFILNGSGTGDKKTHIKDEYGNILYRGSGTVAKNLLTDFENKTNRGERFKLPSEYDFILATYSQFNSKDLSLKKKFLQEMANGAVVIMDESHNASGDSNVGKYLMSVLESTLGVSFLSATFAKRPDNMPIYASKTSMSEANMDTEALINAILVGGVALQEIVSNAMVAEGQMIRRQRSFEGIETNYEYLDQTQTERGYPNLDKEAVHLAAMDKATEIIRDIIAFQRDYVNPVIAEIDKIQKMEYKGADGGKGKNFAGADNPPIFNGIFNVINQLLFSIKAEAVADVAIKRLQEGKKPIIAFANTMESFLNGMTNDDGTMVEVNDIVSSDFSKIFEKRLTAVLKYFVSDDKGEKEPAYIDPQEQDPEFRVEYGRIRDKIKNMSIGISSSPIDVLIDKIEKAGYSVIEVTGRNRCLKMLGGSKAQIKNRDKTSPNDAFRKFNNNQVDCLMINQSGSTGASAHAIVTKMVPASQVKQRVMIFLQAELNINTEVQKRGRINRTGQILKPIYDYVSSAIPAEKRLMMMLQKKMKSLDANTTSSQKTSRKPDDNSQTDFLNKYGDEIVYEYLKENPAINSLIGDPLKMEENGPDDKPNIDGAAHKVSGRVAILPSKDQENFYREIGQRYNALVEYLIQTDEYDLEVTEMDLKAETLEKDIVVVGKDGASVFSRHSILEKCSVVNLKKPYSKAELDNLIAMGLNGLEPEAQKNEILDKHARFVEAQLVESILETNAHYDLLIKNIPKEKGYETAENKKYFIDFRTEALNNARHEATERNAKIIGNKKGLIREILSYFHVGQLVGYPTVSYNEDRSFSKAIFVGFVINEELKNPYAPSAVKLKFVIASAQRYVALPASKTDIYESIRNITNQNFYHDEAQWTIDNWDEVIKSKTTDRSIRYIVTGNVLQAFGRPELKGNLISYTTISGGSKKGILLPETFSKLGSGRGTSGQKVMVPIITALPIIKGLSSSGNSILVANGGVTIGRSYYTFKLTVPASKSKGGDKYYLDKPLMNMSQEGTFNKVSATMVANYALDRIDELVKYLQDKFQQSVLLESWQFEQIRESLGEVNYDDEEQDKPLSDVFINKITAEEQEEQKRREEEEARKKFEDEQRRESDYAQAEEDARKAAEALAIENRKLAAKKKLLQLMRLLLKPSVMMARGGRTVKSDIELDVLKKCYDIGYKACDENTSRTPAQNKELIDLCAVSHSEHGIGWIPMMQQFERGYFDRNEVTMRELFPEMYKNR
jgi:hypothetical protein